MSVASNGQFRDQVIGRVLMSHLVVLMILPGCAGPQPLNVAINPRDQQAYVSALNEVDGDARQAFASWMAEQRGLTPVRVLAEDTELNTAQNPFDAFKDPDAVSRGAVIYQLHCARCHGFDAGGKGPSALPEHPATSFKTFGKRLAATLHRGAPRKWFRVISEGSGALVDYPDERTTAMPAFVDKMTREQIWLVITYLQSLDIHVQRDRKRTTP